MDPAFPAHTYQPDGSELTVVSSIIESSQETGWNSEPGELTDFALEEIGPVRAVFRMSKTLEGGYKLARRFLFYADRFEVVSVCEPRRPLLTRTMYVVDGIADLLLVVDDISARLARGERP